MKIAFAVVEDITALGQYKMELNAQCDFLVKFFAVRIIITTIIFYIASIMPLHIYNALLLSLAEHRRTHAPCAPAVTPRPGPLSERADMHVTREYILILPH